MTNKHNNLKKKLYFTRLNILFNKGLRQGKITKFDEEIYEKMSNTIIACLPVSLYIKYSKYLFAQGTCYDRSLYMFLALEEALLVRGDNKDLEYNYGKNNAGHGWIEIGNYVYDPSLMLKFDKDTYYSLYNCSNVKKIDKKYIKANYKFDEFWKDTKNVFEIHNLAYQGIWFEDILDFANMRKDIVYNEWGCEHYGRVNWMKGAINYSDKVLVVSPKYAEEILGSEFGEGMDYTLRGHTHKIEGILNGIDYDAFNPKTDKNLVKNFDIKSLKNKEENKKAILKEFGLEYNPDRPLIALISRLVGQKGIDLIRQVENDLARMNADFIFLGSGDKEYENLFIWLSNNTPNIRTYVGYKGDLANRIYAGSDFFLMPSQFEPCGLSQLIAMRYGSLPIVRATGGLDNTVVGYPLNDSTGFKFWNYDGWAMKSAIECAMYVYKDKYTLDAMRKSAMERDFSWKESAKKYLELYKGLIR